MGGGGAKTSTVGVAMQAGQTVGGSAPAPPPARWSGGGWPRGARRLHFRLFGISEFRVFAPGWPAKKSAPAPSGMSPEAPARKSGSVARRAFERNDSPFTLHATNLPIDGNRQWNTQKYLEVSFPEHPNCQRIEVEKCRCGWCYCFISFAYCPSHNPPQKD